jgi:hypothetical protein
MGLAFGDTIRKRLESYLPVALIISSSPSLKRFKLIHNVWCTKHLGRDRNLFQKDW